MREKNNFYASLKSLKKGVGSRVGSESGSGSITQRYGSADPDPYRTKMSRNSNTDFSSLCSRHGIRPPFVSRKAKIMAQMCAMQKNFAAGHKTLLEGMKVCVMH